MSYTPGPWDVVIRGTVPIVEQMSGTKARKLGVTPAKHRNQQGRFSICVVSEVYMDKAERLSNARLIASAPTLLSSLEALLAACVTVASFVHDVLECTVCGQQGYPPVDIPHDPDSPCGRAAAALKEARGEA